MEVADFPSALTPVADVLQGHLTPILTAILGLHMPLIQPGDVSGLDHFFQQFGGGFCTNHLVSLESEAVRT